MKIKQFIKNKKNLYFFFFIAITFVSFLLRFWHYEEVVNFYLDGPAHLHEVKDMVDSGSIRLIGPVVVTKEVLGRFFFNGPFYYWILAILGIFFNWSVVAITAFFTFLWVGSFALIYFWLRRRFSEDISLLTYATLSFLPVFIALSRMVWNPHFLPLFGVLLLWFLETRGERKLNWLLAGLFFGLGIHFHYSAFLWLLILFYYLIEDLKKKNFFIKNWLLLGVGVILAESPLILFELRHNFYNLRTIIFQIQHFKPTPGYTLLLPHYYWFPLIPVIVKFYALFLEKLKSILGVKVVIIFGVALVGYFLMVSIKTNDKLTYYPPHWTLEKQEHVIDLIIHDNEETFEVASIIGPDTRALDLRWWLREREIKPLGVKEYTSAVVLYLVAPESRPPEKETVYEIQSLKPFRIANQVALGDGYIFYKLRRLPKEE